MDQRLLLMHQVMLGDGPRLQAYDRAFDHAISPGDVVVDVGAGTLILSLLALRHGARHVYALEADPEMAALARQIAEGNDLKGRLTLIQGDARNVRLPERADVIVCEMMGNLGPEEEMAEIVNLVARRHLRAGGRIVPAQLTTHLQAIHFDREGWGVWQDDFLGFSLAAVQAYAAPSAQLHFFSRLPTLLSAPVIISDNRLGQAARYPQGEHLLKITTPGNLHALIGYFTAALAPGVTLSNFPSYPGCNWAVWVWPLRHTAVAAGDTIKVDIERPAEVRLATNWRLDCRIARGSKSS